MEVLNGDSFWLMTESEPVHEILVLRGGRKGADEPTERSILAHQIGISAFFTHMRKFYLTYPAPSCGKDKNEQQHAAHTVTSICDVVVMLK